MASKSNTTDKTSTSKTNNVTDRRVVQERGNQILDSIITQNDDKVVRAAMSEASILVSNLANANSVSVGQMLGMIDRALAMANKQQMRLDAFGFKMLEDARRDLLALQDQGQLVLKLADQTVGQAMTMAQAVVQDQARASATALEIVADMKSGDYAETLKSLSAMVMGFTLLALVIVKGRR